MELTEKQIAELKKIELGILASFIDVCKKLNVRYYLLGGTLLGAIRHKGFIPWDDDIDIGMPREDYEIFLKKAQSLLPENLFVQTIYTDREYLNCFAKIRNSNTTFIETPVVNHKMNHGVFIDIFPLDFYPEDVGMQNRIERKKQIYTLRISGLYSHKGKRKWKSRVMSLLLNARYPLYRSVLLKRENMYKSVTSGKFIANYGGAWGKKEIVPAEWYGEGTEVTFEGMQVMAPLQYHQWLSQVYGDYMQLPPVEKRVGHHYVDVIDLEKSYKEYMEE